MYQENRVRTHYTRTHAMLSAAIIFFGAAISISVAQVRTITLDQNYAGAPSSTVRQTDQYGSIMGEPLPVPSRPNHVFRGWFTTASATGGNRVLVGATGTRFTGNTTVYARWREATPVSINDIPPVFKENFDWIRYVRHNGQDGGKREVVFYDVNSDGSVGRMRRQNFIWDQIFHGQGTINWAVRWHSDRVVTLAERQAIALLLHEEINKWTRPLIGMEGWPYQEIPVTVVGWAVSNASFIQDRQPNETIWVNNDHREPRGIDPGTAELMASAPDNISRFVNFNNVNSGRYTYPGGLHARFDMVLWPTKGMGGGAGGDWGSRLGDTYTITAANNPYHANNTFILTHEIGHGFGLYDFYGAVGTDRPPQTSIPDATGNREFNRGDLRTVMSTSTNPRVAAGPDLVPYDQWQIRYYWDWIRTDSPSNRFPRPTTSVEAPAVAARVSPAKASPVKFDNRGNVRYDLGGANATLKIFDSRGRLLKTMRLDGNQNSVSTNINAIVAPQMLIWRVEADGGKVVDRGRVRVFR